MTRTIDRNARSARVTAFLAVATLMLAMATACGSSDASGGGSVTTSDLNGSTYVSTSVTGHRLVDGTTIKLTFEGDTMSVYAGCNTQSGSYTLVDSTLTFTDHPASTMMACSDQLTAQDAWLHDVLISGVTTTLDGTKLTLVKNDVTIELQKQG